MVPAAEPRREDDRLRRLHRAAGHAARHPAGDQGPGQEGLRPADPRRRADLPPRQARHADDGWPGHHRGGAARLRAQPPDHLDVPVGVRTAGAVPVRRARGGRLPRRLHQDQQAALARAAEQGQDRRTVDRGHPVRPRLAAVPRRARRDSGVAVHLLPARHRVAEAAGGAGDHLGDAADRRGEQRREPDRRARRTGLGRLRDDLRRVHPGQHLAVQPVLRLHRLRRPQVLRGARPVRPRRGGRRAGRSVLRLPVVERRTGQDLHGRHRLAVPRRRAGRHGDLHPHRTAAGDLGWPAGDRGDVGDPAGRFLQAHQGPAAVQDVTDPPSLRAAELGPGDDRDAVLDHRRALRRRRAGHLLRGVGRRDECLSARSPV